MRKIIFSGLAAMVLLNAGGASACVFADDPAACEKRQHCEDQGWFLKPFCKLGITHNPDGK